MFAVFYNPRTGKHFAAEENAYSLPTVSTGIRSKQFAWSVANAENYKAERQAQKTAEVNARNARREVWAAETALRVIGDDETLTEAKAIAQKMLDTATAARDAAEAELADLNAKFSPFRRY